MKLGSSARRAAVLICFVGLACVYTQPLIRNLSTRLFDPGDPLLLSWTLAWNLHSWFTDPLNVWNANIFHPYTNSLAFSEAVFGQSLLLLPVYPFSQNPILLHNLSMLTGMVLSAFCAYALAWRATRSHLVSLLPGIAFAFCPFRLSHLARLQMHHGQWIPLTLLLLGLYFHYVPAGARKRLLYLGAAVLSFVMQGMSNGYYFLFLAPVLLMYQCVKLYSAQPRWKLAMRRDLAVFWAASALCILPVAVPYLLAKQQLGLTRELDEALFFSAEWKNYLAYSRSNKWFGVLTARFGHKDGNLTPGIVLTLLAFVPPLVACCSPSRWRSSGRRYALGEKGFYWLLFVFAVWMSLGPEFSLFGKPVSGLYAFFYKFVPGYQGLRVPARFAVMAYLAIGMIAAMNLGAMVSRIKRLLIARVIVLSSVALLCLEYVPTSQAMLFWRGDQAVHQWLKEAPRGPVIEFPVRSRPRDYVHDVKYTFYSTIHWQRLFNGYSGYTPPAYDVIIHYLQDFPDETTIEMLRYLGIRYVVLHRASAERVDECARYMDQQFTDGSDYVFVLDPEGASAPFDFGPVKPSILAVDRWEFAGAEPQGVRPVQSLRDGSRSKRWHPVENQKEGMRIDLAFQQPEQVTGVALHMGDYPGDFPRGIRLLGRDKTGQWKPLPAKVNALRYVRSILEHPRDASFEIFVEQVELTGLRLELSESDPARAFSIVELDVLQ